MGYNALVDGDGLLLGRGRTVWRIVAHHQRFWRTAPTVGVARLLAMLI